jgi:DNA helicase II / ATP-dependent DNA helicase PcrA
MSIYLTPAPTTQAQLQRLRQGLRPGQRRMADWQGGTLAVSAVPGAGKSTGMAIAAAILLAERYLARRPVGAWEGEGLQVAESRPQSVYLDTEPTEAGSGQLLLVTFTRSAVANLKTKIRQYLRELGVPPQGFMVHTLHGLALTIATRHPELSGLDWERLMLISPSQSNRLVRASVEQWMAAHPRTYQNLLEGRQFDGEETERLRRQSCCELRCCPIWPRPQFMRPKALVYCLRICGVWRSRASGLAWMRLTTTPWRLRQGYTSVTRCCCNSEALSTTTT